MIQTRPNGDERGRSVGKNEVNRYYYKLIGHEFRSLQLDANLKNKSVFDLIDYCELLYEKLADTVVGDEDSLKSYIRGYLIFNYFINSFIMLHFKGFDQFIKSNEYDFIIYLNVFAFYNTDELIKNKAYTIPLPQLRLMVLDYLEDRNLLKFDVNELYQWLYEYIDYLKKKDNYQMENNDSQEEDIQEISKDEYEGSKIKASDKSRNHFQYNSDDSDQENYSNDPNNIHKTIPHSQNNYNLASQIESLDINGHDSDSDLSIKDFQDRYPSIKLASPAPPKPIEKDFKSNEFDKNKRKSSYIDTPPPIPTQLPPGLPLINGMRNGSTSSLTDTPSSTSKTPYPIKSDVQVDPTPYPIDTVVDTGNEFDNTARDYGSTPHLLNSTTTSSLAHVPGNISEKPRLPNRNSLPPPTRLMTSPNNNIPYNGSYSAPRPATQNFSYFDGTHNFNGNANMPTSSVQQNYPQTYSQPITPNGYPNQFQSPYYQQQFPQQQFDPQQPVHPQYLQQQYMQQQYYAQQQHFQQQQYQQNFDEQTRHKQLVMAHMKDFQICGLKNFGSSCYINSTIQLLFGIIEFKQLFSNLRYNQFIRTPRYIAAKKDLQKNSKENVLLSEAISGLLKSFVLHGGASIAPTKFIRISSLLKPDFNIPYEQQDSQEFLLFVLDRLHEELSSDKQEAKELNVVLFENYMREWKINVLSHELEGYYKWYKSLIEFEGTSPIHDLFEGHLQNKLVCNKCKYESINYSPFTILSLPIPSRSIHGGNGTPNSPIDLSDCLRYYTQDEILSGENAWNCPKCNKQPELEQHHVLDDHPVFTKKPGIFKLSRRSKSPMKEAKKKDKKKGTLPISTNTSTKKIHFIKLPPVLFIHLSRFSFNLTDKLDTVISYPLELKFNNYSNESIITYRLCGIINHYGTLKSGHYTSLVDKSPQSVENGPYWCYFDDELVKSNIKHVTQSFKASSKDVYVLCYQRVQ